MSGSMWPGMMIGGLFWIVWLGVSVFALIAFFRGMQALTQMARSLERIESILSERQARIDRGAM